MSRCGEVREGGTPLIGDSLESDTERPFPFTVLSSPRCAECESWRVTHKSLQPVATTTLQPKHHTTQEPPASMQVWTAVNICFKMSSDFLHGWVRYSAQFGWLEDSEFVSDTVAHTL